MIIFPWPHQPFKDLSSAFLRPRTLHPRTLRAQRDDRGHRSGGLREGYLCAQGGERWTDGLVSGENFKGKPHLAMDQYLLIPFLVGWTSIYQLFWCSPGVQGFDTLPSIMGKSMVSCFDFPKETNPLRMGKCPCWERHSGFGPCWKRQKPRFEAWWTWSCSEDDTAYLSPPLSSSGSFRAPKTTLACGTQDLCPQQCPFAAEMESRFCHFRCDRWRRMLRYMVWMGITWEMMITHGVIYL